MGFGLQGILGLLLPAFFLEYFFYLLDWSLQKPTKGCILESNFTFWYDHSESPKPHIRGVTKQMH